MVRKSVAEILTNHVTFELEAIDRMYLNAYVPSLQTGGGFVWFVKTQLVAIYNVGNLLLVHKHSGVDPRVPRLAMYHDGGR